MNAPLHHAGESRSNSIREQSARLEPKALRTYTPTQAVIARSAGVFHFTPEGKLHRFAILEDGRPRRWTVVAADETHLRYEYDQDADGRVERAEIVLGGRVARVELDTDRDGRVDRWQEWNGGRMTLESLDTDGDGRPDRHLRFGPEGRLRGVERPPS